MADDVNALRIELQRVRRRLKYFEQHHRQCFISRQPSPPPDDECSNELMIIPFDPEAVENSNVETEDSRWRASACQLVGGVPDALAWIKKKEDLGLDDTTAIRLIFSGFTPSIVPGADSADVDGGFSSFTIPGANSCCLPSLETDAMDLIASGTAFARITKRSGVKADLAVLVKTYQEFIVVSLAAVYEKHGIGLCYVDAMMREISKSGEEHLSRLRRGAVWLNNTIAQLWASTHWGSRAGDAVFFSGLPKSKYPRLWGSTLSQPFIIKKLMAKKYTSQEVITLRATPLSIPAFIKMIVREKLTVQEICTTLGYHDFIDEITELCTQYETILAPTKRRTFNSSQNPLEWETIIVDGQLDWEAVYNPYMGAAEAAENVEVNPNCLNM